MTNWPERLLDMNNTNKAWNFPFWVFLFAHLASCSVSQPCASSDAKLEDIELNKRTGELYVTDSFSKKILVISTKHDELSETIDLTRPAQNLAISPDGFYLFVATINGDILVIDANQHKTIKSYETGLEKINNIVLGIDGKTAYITQDIENGKLHVFDIKNFALIASIETGGFPQSIAISNSGKYAYIENSDYTISVVDLNKNTIKRAIVTKQRTGGIAFGSNENFVYASSLGRLGDSGSLDAISVSDGVVKNTVLLSHGEQKPFYLRDAAAFYLVDSGGHRIVEVGESPLAFLREISVDAPIGKLLFGYDNRKIYATNTRSKDYQVMVIDPKTGSILRKIGIEAEQQSYRCNSR